MADLEILEQEYKVYRDAAFKAEMALRLAQEAAKRKCHWCDKRDEDNELDGYGPLIDFTLITSEHEEGYARIERFACQEHFEWLHQSFDALGFTTHAHGGICFLEALDCPGYTGSMDECPTPEEQFEEE